MKALIVVVRKVFLLAGLMASAGLYGQNTRALMDEAREYYNKRDYQKAIEIYSDIIAADPSASDAYLWRGFSYHYIQKRVEAVADFNVVLKLDNNNVRAYVGRGGVYLSQKHFQPALSDFETALELDHNNVSAWLGRGQVMNGLKDYQQAVYDLTHALELDAKTTAPYSHRGFAYSNLFMYDSAIADMDKAIAANGNSSALYNNRGLYHNRNGNYKESVEDFDKAIKLDPKNGGAYISIISPLVRLRRFNDAKSYYETYEAKGLTSFISNPKYKFYQNFIRAATVYVPAEDWSRAIDALDSAEQTFGEDLMPETRRTYVDLLSLGGYVLNKLGMTDDAKDVFEQSLAIDPKQPELLTEVVRIEKVEATRSLVGDAVAPEITLYSPTASRSFTIEDDKPMVEVVGKAKDSSGIQSVMVNGKPVRQLGDDGLFIADAELGTGADNLVIEATDKANNKAVSKFTIPVSAGKLVNPTAPARLEAAAAPALPAKSGNYYAILIAASEYADSSIPDLKKPVLDAMDLRSVLIRDYTFESENIDTVFNASREQVMGAISRRSNRLTENDNLLIFYAGHGTTIKDLKGNNDGFWLPSSAIKGDEFTYISQGDINNAIKRSKAKHILVVADACFSGAFILGDTRFLGNDAGRDIVRQYEAKSRQIMASGSLEVVPDESVFLGQLRRKLDENKDKYLPTDDLFIRMKPGIITNSNTLPQYAPILNVGHDGGQFIFIKR